jgi:hypothetical protein
MLVEWHEGDDVAIRRHQYLLVDGHDPLIYLRLCLEEPALDKGLHASAEDIRAMPRLHGERTTEYTSTKDRAVVEGREQVILARAVGERMLRDCD